MTNPPTGTVTFLFTDIEGSTRLWENYPVQMEADLARHDKILRQTVEEHDGYVFKMVGDACCAAFAYPREALRAALAAQRALFAERWGVPADLRVRIALHTGATVERDGDYFGPPVNQVARLLGAGHGGQVLLSGATHNLVRDHPELVDKEARLVDSGEYRLRDLTHPVRIYQLLVTDLPEIRLPLKGDKTPEEFDERYRFIKFLGSGGMAKVYLAHDERLDQDVAIKVLHPRYADEEFAVRFQREAKNAAKLRHHTYVVPVHDWGEKQDGTYYMVMEYLPGGTLKDLIVREGPLASRKAVRLTLQAARALEAAHEEGIVHRDIKPQNILLSKREDAKVADFGIARAAFETRLTHSGTTLGTPHYMSPEQGEGEEATFQSDLYSLGVVLYEMLTGKVPYDAKTPLAILRKHSHGQLRPPQEVNANVPELVNDVTVRLLARNPDERYPNVAALIEDLERVQHSLQRAAQKDEAFAETIKGDTSIPSTVEIPDLTGQDVFLATETLAKRDLKLGDQREMRSDALPEGQIVGKSPKAGTEVEVGSLVSVTVSSGPATVEVPELTGQKLPQARGLLTEAGLSLDSKNEATSETISKGRIIKQDPAAGTRVRRGGSVRITLSLGKATTVPDEAQTRPTAESVAEHQPQPEQAGAYSSESRVQDGRSLRSEPVFQQPEPERQDQRPPARRRRILVSFSNLVRVLAVVLVLAVLASPFVYWGATRYFLGFDGDEVVVVYQGLPSNYTLGLDLSKQVRPTGLTESEIDPKYLPPIYQHDLYPNETKVGEFVCQRYQDRISKDRSYQPDPGDLKYFGCGDLRPDTETRGGAGAAVSGA